MGDKEFTKELGKLTKLQEMYLTQLEKCENEYINRFGHHPSDIGNDQWIDSYQTDGNGSMTIKEIEESDKLYSQFN